MKKKFLKFILLAAIGFGFIACGDDETKEVKPVAGFTYVVDELKVTFTDASKDAVSYAWNFGDSKTSTDKNPVHTFAAQGTYEVELTVTSETGHTSSKKETVSLEKPLIKVDGNFSDWAEVPAARLAVATLDTEVSTLHALKEMKFCADPMYIYMYMRLDTKDANAMDIYLNIDNSGENGYNGWMWQNLGANYLMQGFFADNYDMRLAAYNEAIGGGWGWLSPDVVEAGSGLMTISDMRTVSGTIVEFEARIIREFIPNLGNDAVWISVGHSGVAGDAWTTSGGLPTVTSTGDKNTSLKVNLY